MKPEQSNVSGPDAPYTYFFPKYCFAKLTIAWPLSVVVFVTCGVSTSEEVVLLSVFSLSTSLLDVVSACYPIIVFLQYILF